MTTTEFLKSNERYPKFTQNIFHAGDEDQFQQYRDARNLNVCNPKIDMSGNLFVDQPCYEWPKYSRVQADCVINTFRYIFHKFKKGIFVKICENKLKVFLPFSKSNFVNEWGKKIKVNKGTIIDFIRNIAILEGRSFKDHYVNQNTNEWYGNNCLIRYEFPLSEGDTNVENVKNMLEELCDKRKVPDIEFFINRRDFPILTRNGTEAYNHIWGTTDLPLISHAYEKYLPILSMSKSESYADVLIPTWEDWARIQSYTGKYFPRTDREYSEDFNIKWADKKPTAVFRGTSTGCGVTLETNPRLKLAYLSVSTPPDDKGVPYLDAYITKWNLRPRKLQNEEYLQSIDVETLKSIGIDIYKRDSKGNNIIDTDTKKTYYRFEHGKYVLDNKNGKYIMDKYGKYIIDKHEKRMLAFLSPKQQSEYKYIVNVDGHVSAFRLSLELSMGSVILAVNSQWKIWYSNLLIPFTHYVPVKEDLTDLIEKIKWCRENDDKCEKIAKNAREFFLTFLQKDGVLDYTQKILVDLKNEMGVYLYNVKSPLDFIIRKEYEELDYSFPETAKRATDLRTIPNISDVKDPYSLNGRSYGMLQGMEWVTRKIIVEENFETMAIRKEQIFVNKLGVVNHFSLAGFSMAVKTTLDPQKIKEHIHETFVGTCVLNKLSKFIPNFVYIFGLYKNKDTYNVVTEFIRGETLNDYINSKSFSFGEFLFIVLQLCLALQVAQNMCGFVHYDLSPWNIVLQRVDTEKTFEYILAHNRIIQIRTKIIPVIIDFGKSHVINKNIHHGFINMFNVSTVQDILTLLLKSCDQILKSRKLDHDEFGNFLHLLNFISGTNYREQKFETAQSARIFLRNARKYTALISDNKYELEKLTPYDLIRYIMKMKYKFQLGNIKKYNSYMNKGNGRQIFEYIFSNTTDERVNTYKNVFIRLKQCTLPQPKNLFFIYYVVQSFENNLSSVFDNMIHFLKTEKINIAPYEKIYKETMSFLEHLYKEKIDTIQEKTVKYNVTGNFKELITAPYTEETFLDPTKVINLLNSDSCLFSDDLSDYKEIVEMILLDNGIYKLQDKHRIDYLDNFDILLRTSGINMKNNSANGRTLKFLSHKIYQEDKKELQIATQLVEKDCDDAQLYLELYKQF
jgi:serine/threonine protein kinase